MTNACPKVHSSRAAVGVWQRRAVARQERQVALPLPIRVKVPGVPDTRSHCLAKSGDGGRGPGPATRTMLAGYARLPASSPAFQGRWRAARLGEFLEQAREQIAGSDVAGFDETGFRVDGRLAWVHRARTGKYKVLMMHPSGKKAMEAIGVLPVFTGVAMHDAWAPYDGYASADHQLCCAHALRELQAVTDARRLHSPSPTSACSAPTGWGSDPVTR